MEQLVRLLSKLLGSQFMQERVEGVETGVEAEVVHEVKEPETAVNVIGGGEGEEGNLESFHRQQFELPHFLQEVGEGLKLTAIGQDGEHLVVGEAIVRETGDGGSPAKEAVGGLVGVGEAVEGGEDEGGGEAGARI